MSKEKYNIMKINDIICNKSKHLVALFKEHLLYNETNDFLRRYYNKNESKLRIIKLTNFYARSSMFFPNYIVLDECKYIYSNLMKKQNIIDMIEEMEEVKENKKFIKKRIIKEDKEDKEDKDKIFNTKIYESIVFETDISGMNKIFSLKNEQKINKKEQTDISEIEDLIKKISFFANKNDLNIIKKDSTMNKINIENILTPKKNKFISNNFDKNNNKIFASDSKNKNINNIHFLQHYRNLQNSNTINSTTVTLNNTKNSKKNFSIVHNKAKNEAKKISLNIIKNNKLNLKTNLKSNFKKTIGKNIRNKINSLYKNSETFPNNKEEISCQNNSGNYRYQKQLTDSSISNSKKIKYINIIKNKHINNKKQSFSKSSLKNELMTSIFISPNTCRTKTKNFKNSNFLLKTGNNNKDKDKINSNTQRNKSHIKNYNVKEKMYSSINFSNSNNKFYDNVRHHLRSLIISTDINSFFSNFKKKKNNNNTTAQCFTEKQNNNKFSKL